MNLLTTLLINLFLGSSLFAGAITYKTVTVDNLEIFYREAGDPAKHKTILLLHGFPTSSQMYDELMRDLSDRYHLVAPDYPGFGKSSQPSPEESDYSFKKLTDVMEQFVNKIGVKQYALYLMDYGAPIGLRLALRNPSAITSLIVQNGNAYEEGLREFWDPVRKY